MLGSVSFSSFIWNSCGQGRKKAQPTQEEGTKEGFARWEKEIKKIKRLNIDFCCFFF